MFLYQSHKQFKTYRPRKSLWQRFLARKKNKKKRRALLTCASSLNSRLYYKKNPFKKVKNVKWRLPIKIIILLVIFIAWLSTMLYLPFFQIKNIHYIGLKNIKKTELDEYVRNNILKEASRLWPYNNYFLNSPHKINKKLTEQFSLKSVQTTKIFPNTLQIELEEKISSVIYDDGRHYYWMDQNGAIIKAIKKAGEDEYIKTAIASFTIAAATSTPTETAAAMGVSAGAAVASSSLVYVHTPNWQSIYNEYGRYPILFDNREQTRNRQSAAAFVMGNEIILDKSIVANLINWQEGLPKHGIEPRYFLIEESLLAGIKIFTNRKWSVYINPRDDFKTQLEKLLVILNKHHPQEYIDLRVGNKVFWK